MICHVLRYAPFYVAIRERVARGDIGQIINIQTAEHVSYDHMTLAYVRGKWNTPEASGSSMLMAKSCHDLDILAWMKTGSRPRRVSSFGSLMYFRPEQAPTGAGTRCLLDCPIERRCLYSAQRHYIERALWQNYVWSGTVDSNDTLTDEQKIDSLRETNRHGRCVWHSDNAVVDHQSVIVEFADGSTASHNMVGNAARRGRPIHIIGTLGEIQGVLEDSAFTVRKLSPGVSDGYVEEKIAVTDGGGMHGGGDLRLVADFVAALRGTTSLSTTTLDDSIDGHLIGFAADKAMNEHRCIDMEEVANDAMYTLDGN